ncbi:chorismate mutase [Halanaerobacter jeridensis]|uniref:chorismate mutase n=1 Tax=Halanaerobacter jeridensis TaxID=706427 RepID=A0A938XUC5_9FIRM|nr:chorismate mutase [Halanaerobacter jeridensis]MBM7556481.1 chorismate mutase [Halanaerobacter jeridensis]
MKVRGIRGAITVTEDTEKAIITATTKLLNEMIAANGLEEDNVASVTFSLTPDLNSAFPAVAARELGWDNVALFCCQELAINDALDKCIRILIHYNTDKKLGELNHIYLKDAKKLRPDLAEEGVGKNGE